MIDDVDESLRALVKRDALNGSQVQVAFDAPTKDWAARQNAPTVDLYLYDIREDLERRETMWERVTDDKGIVSERRPPARRFKLSYLITAWTQRPEDEHRLLSAMLSCFVRHETVPRDVLPPALAEQHLPIYLTVGLPPPQDRSISDVWSALGGELKPSLDLIVVTPVPVRLREEVAGIVIEEPKISMLRPDAEAEQVAGRRAAAREAAQQKRPTLEETVHGGKPGRGRTIRLRELPRR